MDATHSGTPPSAGGGGRERVGAGRGAGRRAGGGAGDGAGSGADTVQESVIAGAK